MDDKDIEISLQEFEEGFHHLLDGIRSILREANEKILTLQARLEEHRLINGTRVTQLPQAPIITTELPEFLPKKKRRWKPVNKKCMTCPNIMTNVNERRVLCETCLRKKRSEWMVTLQAQRKNARLLAKTNVN